MHGAYTRTRNDKRVYISQPCKSLTVIVQRYCKKRAAASDDSSHRDCAATVCGQRRHDSHQLITRRTNILTALIRKATLPPFPHHIADNNNRRLLGVAHDDVIIGQQYCWDHIFSKPISVPGCSSKSARALYTNSLQATFQSHSVHVHTFFSR